MKKPSQQSFRPYIFSTNDIKGVFHIYSTRAINSSSSTFIQKPTICINLEINLAAELHHNVIKYEAPDRIKNRIKWSKQRCS